MLGVLGVREGEAAELVCAGLRGATGVEAVSASKVLSGVLSSGTPVASAILAFSKELRDTSVEVMSGVRGDVVSEESFPLSEVLVGEDAVV